MIQLSPDISVEPDHLTMAVRSSRSVNGGRAVHALTEVHSPPITLMPQPPVTIAKADLIEGMVRGMAVLESFDTERQRLNATLAAHRAGITRAAARRHLLTLAHLGYLETDGSWFWLSSKVLRFSGSYLASSRLPRVVQPLLERLAMQCRHPMSVVVRDGDECVIVARSGAPLVLAYGLHLGARLPLHATSTGRVLLAAAPRAELVAWLKGRALVRHTPHTIHQAASLQRNLNEVRQQGWALACEQHEPGISAIAVPVQAMNGRVVGALNMVAAATAQEAPGRLLPALAALQEAARQWRPML